MGALFSARRCSNQREYFFGLAKVPGATRLDPRIETSPRNAGLARKAWDVRGIGIGR
jgi:hypothetical protein